MPIRKHLNRACGNGFRWQISRSVRYPHNLGERGTDRLTDFIALTVCFGTSRHASSNQQFVLLYLTSAVTTVISMMLFVPKHEKLLKYLITITGAVLLLFIAAWIAK